MNLLQRWKRQLIGEDRSFGAVPFLPKDTKHKSLRYLLIQHTQGHWDFPKGHAEGNESPIESAHREVAEETGLQHFRIWPEPKFTVEYYFHKKGRNIHKTVEFFIAEVHEESLSLQTAEIQDAAWMTYQSAMKKITFPAGKKLLTQVDTFLRKTEKI